MKIGILTWGSNGDTRPFIALAAGLGAKGHDVRLHIASIESRDYSRFAQLPGVSLGQLNVPEPAKDIQLRLEQIIISEPNPLKQLEYVIEHFFNPVEEELLQVSRELCSDCDIVIGHVILYQLDIAARESATPRISIALSPFLPSGHISPFGNISLGVIGNRLIWKLAQFAINRFLKKQVNTMRQRQGLPPMHDFFHEVGLSPDLNLLAASPTLVPPPPDWPAHCKVPGFFNIDERAEPWDMPADLRTFIDAGSKPVFIGFGSMMDVSVRHRETTLIIMEAVRQAGCRAIVQSRWGELEDIATTPEIYRLTSAPHKYLFPHCDLVVHHGGAGTTQSALLAGCAQVIVPHGMDQAFWAGRLQALGVSGGHVFRRKLKPERLAKLLRTSLARPQLRAKAETIAERVRQENGVVAAVREIESWAAGLGP